MRPAARNNLEALRIGAALVVLWGHARSPGAHGTNHWGDPACGLNLNARPDFSHLDTDDLSAS